VGHHLKIAAGRLCGYLKTNAGALFLAENIRTWHDIRFSGLMLQPFEKIFHRQPGSMRFLS